MPKLTVTSTFASTVIVGDPAILTITLPPKESRTVEVTEVQLRQLTPGLDKIQNAGWITYGIAKAAPVAEVVKVAEVLNVTPAPAPVVVAAVPFISSDAPADTASDAATDTTNDATPAAAPSAPKAPVVDKSKRNR